jgi:hypothetical protein
VAVSAGTLKPMGNMQVAGGGAPREICGGMGDPFREMLEGLERHSQDMHGGISYRCWERCDTDDVAVVAFWGSPRHQLWGGKTS